MTLGERTLVRVQGTLSDAQAGCRLRIGSGAWRACRPKASGAFSRQPAAAGHDAA